MQTNSEGFSSNSNLRNFCPTHNTKLFFGWKHIKWPFIWCNVITFFKNTAPSSEYFVPGVKPIKNRVQKLWKKLSNSIKLQAGTTFKPISSAKLIRIFKNCSPLSPTLTSGPPLKITQNWLFYCNFTLYLTNFGYLCS